MLERLSLRTRLVLGVLVLAAAGLAVADIVTYTSLRSFLVQRIDNTLDAEHDSVRHRGGFGGPRGGGGFGGPAPAANRRRTCSSSTGRRTARRSSPRGARALLPARARRRSRSCRRPSRCRARRRPFQDVIALLHRAAQDGGDRYRVRAPFEGGDYEMLVVAMSLHDVDGTLHRLLLIELLVTAAVLLAIGAAGFWVVSLGLRPLRAIEQTAGAIASGDLSQRVERAEERTEVGRLGLALNAMLSQIEAAFKAREASERKLRRFVADASHELRTPLAAVRAYAELFTRGADRRPDDLARAMTGITRESERMSLLVQDLLLLARLDEGRPLEREPVQLDDVVGEAVETARMVEPGRPIELDADTAVVLGDRDRLRQIVDNLLSNVRAHTPPETPVHVTVGARQRRRGHRSPGRGPGPERRAPRACVRALLPRRPVARARERRRRARPLDRRRGCGGARRHRHRTVRAAGSDVPHRHPAVNDNSHGTPSAFPDADAEMGATTNKGGV